MSRRRQPGEPSAGDTEELRGPSVMFWVSDFEHGSNGIK